MMDLDVVLHHMRAELVEIEKAASVPQVRALRQGLDAAENAYAAGKNALGLRRFFTADGREWRAAASANLKNARTEFGNNLRGVRAEALANAAKLGPDASEHAATVRAADMAQNRMGGLKRGVPIPEGFSPGEKAQQTQQAASQGFRRKLALGGAAAVGAGAFLATRPRQDPYAAG